MLRGQQREQIADGIVMEGQVIGGVQRRVFRGQPTIDRVIAVAAAAGEAQGHIGQLPGRGIELIAEIHRAGRRRMGETDQLIALIIAERCGDAVRQILMIELSGIAGTISRPGLQRRVGEAVGAAPRHPGHSYTARPVSA